MITAYVWNAILKTFLFSLTFEEVEIHLNAICNTHTAKGAIQFRSKKWSVAILENLLMLSATSVSGLLTLQ